MGNFFKYIFPILLFLGIAVWGLFLLEPSNIPKHTTDMILPDSRIYLSEVELSPKEILAHTKHFTPYHKCHLNLGVSKKYIYIHFTLNNPSNSERDKVLVINSPLIEEALLYIAKDNRLETPLYQGIKYKTEEHRTLSYYYALTLKPHSSLSVYLLVHNRYNPVNFTLSLKDPKEYLQHDRLIQAVSLLLIGMVLALMFYSLFLAYYTQDRSYFFYGVYLVTMTYQQISYLGLSKIYFPKVFLLLDLQLFVFKISAILIATSLFSIHFLETKKYPFIHKIYLAIIAVSFVEILILPPEKGFSFDLMMLESVLFILFNLYSAIYIYRKGFTQARLLILGFGIVSLVYLAIILDTLGVTSLLEHMPIAITLATVFEAFVLSLAFADRYLILREQRLKQKAQLLHEMQYRNTIIKAEVVQKTQSLKKALETKDLLIREIHHRVKNNLQLILSMLRLQNDRIDDTKINQKLLDLEHRINAISKTYELLLENENLEHIDMKIYIKALIMDIRNSFPDLNSKIDIETDINAVISIKQSIYIGLILNELVTNSFKYAFCDHQGHIKISFKKENSHYTLVYQDDGKGFTSGHHQNTLGIRLIRSLVEDQLEGKMQMETAGHTYYIIEFSS